MWLDLVMHMKKKIFWNFKETNLEITNWLIPIIHRTWLLEVHHFSCNTRNKSGFLFKLRAWVLKFIQQKYYDSSFGYNSFNNIIKQFVEKWPYLKYVLIYIVHASSNKCKHIGFCKHNQAFLINSKVMKAAKVYSLSQVYHVKEASASQIE